MYTAPSVVTLGRILAELGEIKQRGKEENYFRVFHGKSEEIIREQKFI